MTLPARSLRRIGDLSPLTVLGLVTLAAGAAVHLLLGRRELDYVLLAAGMVAVSVVLLSMALSGLGALALFFALRRREEPLVNAEIDADRPYATGFAYPGFRLWPWVEVSSDWVLPERVKVEAAPDGGRLLEVVTPTERGRAGSITRRFCVRDIFGLAKLCFKRRVPAALLVQPRPISSEIVTALRHSSGDACSHPSGEPEGDLVETRRYGPGDPVRLVLWKTYARTRRLLVRMPERAQAPAQNVVSFFVAGEGDEPTASAARVVLDEGALGLDYSFRADGAERSVSERDEAMEQLVDSVSHRDQGGRGLAGLVSEHGVKDLGSCVLFVPGQMGPWLDRVVDFARMLPRPPTVIVGVDGSLDGGRRPRLRWRRRARVPGAPPLEALPPLYDALRALGGTVLVVHRPTGRLLDAASVDLLRAT